MQYPLISEYAKAIQDAGANLNELAHLTPVLDDHGEPYHISGDFFVVFKMQDKNTGKCYALKCFTEKQEVRAEAYRQIANERSGVARISRITITSIRRLEKELLVQSQGKEERYPVMLMNWVDGDSPDVYQLKVEDMSSTEATDEELNEAITDEFGVKYSEDGRKLLQAPKELDGTYSIRKGTKIICDRAFSKCSFLTSIVISNSVVSIGDGAFAGCTSLSSIVIPDSVPSIGDWAFSDCTSLSNIVIPNSVTSIGEGAFSSCTSLSNIVIPDSVTRIGNLAFFNCTSLSNIVISDSVTNIGDDVFYQCSSLTSVVIPNSVTCVGDEAFCNCRSLSNIVIPNSVTSIGVSVFWGCSSLVNMDIPDSVTRIGDWAFVNCSNLSYDLKQELISRFGDELFKLPLHFPAFLKS